MVIRHNQTSFAHMQKNTSQFRSYLPVLTAQNSSWTANDKGNRPLFFRVIQSRLVKRNRRAFLDADCKIKGKHFRLVHLRQTGLDRFGDFHSGGTGSSGRGGLRHCHGKALWKAMERHEKERWQESSRSYHHCLFVKSGKTNLLSPNK